jgi:hypothetical protein
MTSVSPNQDDIANTIADKIALSRDGDRMAAVIAAMLIHRFPDVARKTGVNMQYESLLEAAFLSKDSELLICIAEEIRAGKNLAANGRLTGRFLERADSLSPFMGAYVLGRSVVSRNETLALRFFSKAANAGHIPSIVCLHKLQCKRIPLIGRLVRFFYAFSEAMLIRRALAENTNLYERFWRHTDFFKEREITEKLPMDRAHPFSDIYALAR